MIGRTLSHYQIVEWIAAGGTGAVYRARDLHLKRDVALKVLPAEALADEESRRRFRREALTLSRLNHPNIGVIFDFDSQDGIDFLVMEYVGGPWLDERVRGGPLPERQVVALALQIVDALEAAHREGVVHRDLKPANIGVTSDDHVKVLDFGLARLLRPIKEETTTESYVETKGVAGTLPYMAPEQLLNVEADARSDLYSFGVVLYRMAVGRLPFEQKLPTALVNEILHAVPPRPIVVNKQVSPLLQAIILRCMERDPAHRYQTATDLKADLTRLRSQIESGTRELWSDDAVTRRRERRRRLVIAAAYATAVVGVLAGLLLGKRLAEPPPAPSYSQLTFTGSVSNPVISPDGNSFAYVAISGDSQQVIVRDIAGGEPLTIFRADQCANLRWSPDGSSLLFAALKGSVGGAYVMPRLGGSPQHLPSVGVAMAWSPDGSSYVAATRSGRKLVFTKISTGETSSVPLPNSLPNLVDLDWSPRGDLMAIQTLNDAERSAIWSIRRDGTQGHRLFEGTEFVESPRWSPQGDAIYFLRSNGPAMDLCKIRLRKAGASTSDPQVVLAGLQVGKSLSFSRDGKRMLCLFRWSRSNLWGLELDRRESPRAVRPHAITSGTGSDTEPSLSPDGRWVAYSSGDPVRSNIFVVAATGGSPKQVTFLSSSNYAPAWSPDGSEIAFISSEGSAPRVWRVSAQGGPPRAFQESRPGTERGAAVAWAPATRIAYTDTDGRAFSVLDPGSGRELGTMPADKGGMVFSPVWSPDGVRLAYRGRRAAGPGVWIASLRDSLPIRISSADFVEPLAWSADSRRIYACDSRGARDRIILLSVDGGRFEALIELPSDMRITQPTLEARGSRVVGSIIQRQTDVWMVEGFDRPSR